MPIPVQCECGQSFRAKDELAGRRVKCPKCGQALAIPDPAAEAGGLSLDDLLEMDGAAMPGMPDMQGGNQFAGTQLPGAQFGGAQLPQGGGFQTNPLFGQPAQAATRSSSNSDGFKIAIYALGGLGGLVIVAIVLMIVLKGSNSDQVVDNDAGGTQTDGGNGNGGGTPTEKTDTKTDTGMGTNDPGIDTTAGSPSEGYESPEAAMKAFLDTLRNEDVDAFKVTLQRIAGPRWGQLESIVAVLAKQFNQPDRVLWTSGMLGMKHGLVDNFVSQLPTVKQGEDRAVITIQTRDEKTPNKPFRFVRDPSTGRWNIELSSSFADLAVLFLVVGAIRRGWQ